MVCSTNTGAALYPILWMAKASRGEFADPGSPATTCSEDEPTSGATFIQAKRVRTRARFRMIEIRKFSALTATTFPNLSKYSTILQIPVNKMSMPLMVTSKLSFTRCTGVLPTRTDKSYVTGVGRDMRPARRAPARKHSMIHLETISTRRISDSPSSIWFNAKRRRGMRAGCENAKKSTVQSQYLATMRRLEQEHLAHRNRT